MLLNIMMNLGNLNYKGYWMMYNLQDMNSGISEEMIFFHDLVMMNIVMILVFILLMMFFIIKNKFINLNLLQGNLIEIIWTILPMLILMFLSIPSLKILYEMDELYYPLITIKSIGHQWYWSYEYTDLKKIEFDSYMLKFNFMDEFRLLDVDNRVVLPVNVKIRNLVSSLDVIHSWAMPSLGLKIDGVPGRINQISLCMIRFGLYFGQCSEICGANHSFMPIVIESVNMNMFLNWLNKK